MLKNFSDFINSIGSSEKKGSKERNLSRRSTFENRFQIFVLMAYLFDKNCIFSELPKELLQIIITTFFTQYSVVRNIVRYGSGIKDCNFPKHTLLAYRGHMSTALCEELPGENIIAWEVRLLSLYYLFCL